MRFRTTHSPLALRILCIACLFVSSFLVNAQTTITATGNPNDSARFPIENGFINLGNGNLHLEIPIATFPQRGDLSVGAKFVYDSSVWQVVNSPDSRYPEWFPALSSASQDTVVNGGLGWSFQYGRYYEGSATIKGHTCPSGSNYDNVVEYSNIHWSDPQGTLHVFPITTTYLGNCPGGAYTANRGGEGYAVDGSGYYAVVSNYTNLQVWDSKGVQVVNMPVSGNAETGNPTIDRNGNYISYNQNGSITEDSLQHPNITQKVTSWDSYGYPSVVQLGVPIAKGQTANYTVTYENIPVHTNFQVNGSPWGYAGNVAEFNDFINVIKSIELPDGTSYAFTYDQCPSNQGCITYSGTSYAYGELIGITLPHGGTVSFDYTSHQNAGTTEPARWVSSHSGADGTTTFQYQYAGSYSNTKETGGYSCQEIKNTATSSSLQSTYIFSNCNGNILPMKILQSPVSSPSTVDAFVLFRYDFSHPCQGGACSGAQWTNLLGKTVVLPSTGTVSSILAGTPGTGLTTDIQYEYATPGSGIATSVKQWDFYSGNYPTSLPDTPPGSPARETDLVLGKTVNHALFPTQKTVLNGSGSTTTTYSYDEASYINQSASYASGVSATSIPNHDSTLAASSPGNLTTVTECCAVVNGKSVSLTKHYYYDAAGSVVASTDPNGQNTYVGYDSTDTFPEQITLPSTTGLNGAKVTHVTKSVFDFNSGLLSSYTDQNGQQTTYDYDKKGRLSTVKFSNGGSPVTLKTLTYPSATETDVSELQSPGVNILSSTVFDGYGRPTSETKSGITTTRSYDAQGRLWTVSNPAAATAYSTDGTTTYGYDELGRINSIEMPNSKSIQYDHSLNTVTITDPSGHSRREVFDAFGALSKVLEPSAAGAPNWDSAWATTYTYNGLGLLTSINQQGGESSSSNWRTRTFNYDGAGRLYSQTTQEQGTLTFGYDYNGNLTSSANQNSSNNTVSYSYDEDNRLYKKVVGGGPTYYFTYDAQDSSGDSYGQGRLTGTSDGAKTQSVFTHDPMGNVIAAQYCLPSGGACTFGSQPQAQVQAQFDFQGNMTSLTYPDGRQISMSYNLLNRPISETYASWNGTPVNTPYASNILYYPAGELQAVTYGNGVQMGATFDPEHNISSLVYLGNGSALSSKIYTWDTNATNLLSIQDLSAGRTQSFSYDQLNRIASATDTGTTTKACLANPPSIPAFSETYTIDAWGNLQESAGTLPGSQSFSFQYTPTLANQVVGMVYDSAGNLTSDGSPSNNSYQYRADGLMSSSNGATYTYDALGQRVQKVLGSTATEYIYFGGRLLAAYSPGSASWTDRVYGPGGALATVEGTQSAVPIYRLGDHLGSLGLTTTTDNVSGITGVAAALPFGEKMINSGGDNFPFTDHERDSENLTDATLFRHYSPTQLRWLSPDPYNGSYDLSDPQSLNRYAYLSNRPMNAIDPTGLDNCIIGTIISGGSASTGLCFGGGNGGSGGGGGQGGSGWNSGDGGVWASNSGPILTSVLGSSGYYSMPLSYSGVASNVTADSSSADAPNNSACTAQRIYSGIMGAANLGLAIAKGVELGAAVAGLGATGAGAPAAAVLAVYGTVSIFGQGLTGAAQLYSAFTGNYGTPGRAAQVGNILSGPVSGLGTLVAGGSMATAERNAGYESLVTVGGGFIDAIRSAGNIPLAAADHSAAYFGAFANVGNACGGGN